MFGGMRTRIIRWLHFAIGSTFYCLHKLNLRVSHIFLFLYKTKRMIKKIPVLTLLIGIGQLHAQNCFQTPKSFATSQSPKSVKNADFDHNGIPDMVSVTDSAQFGRITVCMNYNVSSGSFASSNIYSIGGSINPLDLAVADFNGDNLQDIVTANYGSNTLCILPGNGDGTFNTALYFSVGGYPASIAIANFGGDSKPDIAVVNDASNYISVLINTSSSPSSFTFSTTSFTVGNSFNGIVAADFDGANGPDIAAINGSSLVSFLNNGSGGFIQTSSLTTSSVVGITTGDFNGDNFPDLATASSGSAAGISVFINSGTGSFNAPVNFAAGLSGTSLGGITNADFDQDGNLDIAVIGYGTTNGIFTLQGNGSGNFSTASLNLNFTTSSGAIPLNTADYNLDGLPDLIFPLTNYNTANIVLNAKPTITGLTSICAGDITTLTANGSTTYQWSANAGNVSTQTVTLTPGVSTTYTVTGTTSGCTASTVKTVTVNALPTVTASVSTSPICAGQNTVLSATGATSYTWTPGGVSGYSITVSPSANNVYTVTGTSSGCSGTGTVSVVVIPSPTVVVNPAYICTGTGASLTASGANTYIWLPGNATGASIVVSPSVTTNYTVTGTNTGGCSATATTSVNVLTLPTITASASSGTICPGTTTTLTANGLGSCTWSPSGTLSTATGTLVSSFPTANTTYTITGMDAAGCINTTTVSVNLVQLANTGAVVGTGTVCAGADQTYSVTPLAGATSYSWTIQTGATIVAGQGTNAVLANFPSVGGFIQVIPIDACGNNGTSSSISVYGLALPTITVTPSSSNVCSGSSATLTATGTSISYIWNTAATTSVITVTPTAITSYTVRGTDANNCSNIAITTLSINTPPTVTIFANPGSICPGSSTTLTAGGANNYSWSTGATTVSIAPTLSATTSFTVSGTDANNCTGVAITTVTVTNFNSISGTIYDTTTVSGLHPITAGAVYLYTQQTGTVGIDTSSLMSPISSTGTYTFNQVPPGNYYVEAVASITTYTGSIATYLSTNPNPYLWSSATAINHNGCSNGNDSGHDIGIIELPAPSGTGIISGVITNDVSFGHRLANGNNQVYGAPLKGIDVKLGKNPGGGCVARTTTSDGSNGNTIGTYTFTGVPAGDYSIYADIPNFGMTTVLTTSISPANEQSVNNNYCVDSVSINTSCAQTTGIKQLATNSMQVNVYPNPNTGNFIIETTQAIHCTLFDINGRDVWHQTISATSPVDVSTLTNGVYNLSMISNEAVINKRIIITR